VPVAAVNDRRYRRSATLSLDLYEHPKILLLASLVCLFLTIASCSQTADPKVTLSKDRVFKSGHLEMKGTGFTPSATVFSHLKRPDGTEFPVLRMMTDDHGEFTHDIDSLLLSPEFMSCGRG